MSKQENKDIKFVKITPPVGKEQVEFTIKSEDGKAIKIINPKISIKETDKEEVALRDENVQEILMSAPHWMIRWGNVLFLLLVILILFLSWLIKYPDTVSDSVLIEKSQNNEHYIGMILSKNYAFEKVKKGQRAQISLLVYPEYENGILLGIVDTIFWNKLSKQYDVKINLSNDLITTYSVKVNPNTNLEGVAKIIIKDKRLIENFFD